MSGAGRTADPSLGSQTTRAVQAALAAGTAVALLPVGSTEAHGPHLPLATDVVIAEETARRAAHRLAELGIGAFVLPPLPYAVTEFVRAFAGTISVRAETVARLLEEIADSLFRQGFRVLVLVNGHLEPEHARMLRHVARDVTARGGGTVLFPDQRLPPVVQQLGPEFAQGGGHAGGYETSLVLAAAPRLVDGDARRDLRPLRIDLAERIRAGATDAAAAGGPDAYFGDPAAASAAEGERLFEVLAQMVADAARSAVLPPAEA